MSIRLKLLLSYAAMLVVPLVLMLVTSLLLVVVFRGDLQNVKSFYSSKMERFDEGEFQRLMEHTITQNPGLLTNPAYLEQLTEEMSAKEIYLAIRSEAGYRYVSEGIQGKNRLLDYLPGYEQTGYRDREPAASYGNELYTVSQFDYRTATGKPESLFVITKVDPLVYFTRKFFPILLVTLLVILIATHALLTYLMSKNIIRPLLELRRATRRISEGDLDFRVGVGGKDEIGQLGFAFEEMRSRLQQSIRLQLQYEENRKELISNISHDLKTPITAIKGYVDGILDGVADTPDKAEKYIRTISGKAGEMDRLIDELFLYSKLDLKRLPFSFESIPFRAFLADWVEELSFELDKQGISLTDDIRFDPGLTVLADRDQFKRVLSNIIQNSVKYMNKQEKRIRLHAEAGRDTVTLTVEDNGIGIREDALPHIFDRFYRAEQSRNAGTGGSGLGLAIVKQIMDGHGGDIRAESKDGEGTRIVLSLPVHRKEAEER
jgi:signal transduction histidine kinase